MKSDILYREAKVKKFWHVLEVREMGLPLEADMDGLTPQNA